MLFKTTGCGESDVTTTALTLTIITPVELTDKKTAFTINTFYFKNVSCPGISFLKNCITQCCIDAKTGPDNNT